jgi:hypothetical protein
VVGQQAGLMTIDRRLSGLALRAAVEIDNVRLGRAVYPLQAVASLSSFLRSSLPVAATSVLGEPYVSVLLVVLFNRVFARFDDGVREKVADVTAGAAVWADLLEEIAEGAGYSERAVRFCLAVSEEAANHEDHVVL